VTTFLLSKQRNADTCDRGIKKAQILVIALTRGWMAFWGWCGQWLKRYGLAATPGRVEKPDVGNLCDCNDKQLMPARAVSTQGFRVALHWNGLTTEMAVARSWKPKTTLLTKRPDTVTPAEYPSREPNVNGVLRYTSPYSPQVLSELADPCLASHPSEYSPAQGCRKMIRIRPFVHQSDLFMHA